MFAKNGKKGAVDSWLDNLGLYRKNVAYDETCLFRAISEQLFDCQIHHEKVRKECITFARENYEEFSDIFDSKNDFLEHINLLETHMVACGDIELSIINKKYNRSIIIFNATDQKIYHFTNQELPQVFLLCLMDKDHYDVVYRKDHIIAAGFCQSIAYKLLYEEVFKIPNVDEIVHNMLYDKGNIITQAELMIEKKSGSNEPGDANEEKPQDKNAVNVAPFPFKVAKALDPNIYRNIEYDSWGETRREWRLGEWYYGDNKLTLGTKCVYTDSVTRKRHECYIQKIIQNDNKCVIYLTKEAVKRTVSYSELSPEDDAKPWPFPQRFFRSAATSPTTNHIEKPSFKSKKGNNEKKRTKSESSILSLNNAVKQESSKDNVGAYVGFPLQMQSSKSSNSNASYAQTENPPPENRIEPVQVQENVPTVLVENQPVDGSAWYGGYQWQPCVSQVMDQFVWPSCPSTNANVVNYNMKPMVASAPVTPSVIPYHDPAYPTYYYNYHVEPYQSYPQWSSTTFELQAPPPPRNPFRTSQQEQHTGTSGEQDETQNTAKVEVTGTDGIEGSSCTNFLEAPQTPLNMQCSPFAMYSPSSPAPVMHAAPQMTPGLMYAVPPPDLRELVISQSAPVIYSPTLEVPYMPSSPYVYPPTPPPTNWYTPGVTPQGFIFPPAPM